MAFIDKIKSLFSEEKKELAVIKEIQFEDIYPKLQKMNSELKEKKIPLNIEIKNYISDFDKSLSNIMKNLSSVDISDRKEPDKIKFVVRENFDLYIFYLTKLVTDLKSLNIEDSETYLDKVSILLNNFNKISTMPYEKATYLIGKDLGKANDTVKEFYKKIKSLLDKNKSTFEQLESIKKINLLFEDLNKNVTYEKDINSSIKDMNSDLQKAKIDLEKANSQIEQIKSSAEYKKDSDLKKSRLSELEQVKSSLSAIKQKIDFKLLAKHFHFNNKNHELIKAYNNNFFSTLKEDEELKIVDFILSAQNLDFKELKDLRFSLISLDKRVITKSDESINELDASIKALNAKFIDLKKEIDEAEKKKEKNTLKKDKLMEEIKALSLPLLQ